MNKIMFWIYAAAVAELLLSFHSAVGSAIAQEPYSFAIFYFIGGLGGGILSIVVPTYISGMIQAKYRGRLMTIYQFQILFGILIGFLSNHLISGISGLDWRIILCVEAIPALVYLILILIAPQSPRWVIT